MNNAVFIDDDGPCSMRDEGVRERRKAMLTRPHIAELTAYAARLRQYPEVEVPEFDPLDGGVNARVLFLLEKPGPMTVEKGRSEKRSGSGFISRNNDDPTAQATFHFMMKAGIPREKTVIWNIIPWWKGTRKISSSELRDGVQCVKDLRLLLPQLAAVVMVGGKAQRAKRYLASSELKLFTSYHPSRMVRNRHPDKWNSIPSEWAKVLPYIF